MTLLDRLKAGARTLLGNRRADILSPMGPDAESPGARDALSAIQELSRVVRNDPDAVEIYLALGNLYRLRGDIERAVQIRSSLIVRPGLDPQFKARALFELGRDYRRGGVMDRALAAFDEARALGADPEQITFELALLHADSGAFQEAAAQYARLGFRPAQAHYMVRHAEDLDRCGRPDEARALLAKAVKVYPGAVEAWRARLVMAARTGEWRRAGKLLREGLERVPASIRFLLLEGLLELEAPAPRNGNGNGVNGTNGADSADFEKKRCATVLAAIEAQEPDLLLQYYGALFLLRCGNREEAGNWLAKAMVLRPDFWAARLELLSLSMEQQHLSPVFRSQLEYFIEHARKVKRFVCGSCGLRREHTFCVCPRCRSWHSATFRMSLQD
ncbi:tetratricopeptide repeat protein [Desulfovibrio oxamicus]|uniref:Tetratricopeptide repeat protein n=1 Tax=Nitratidesulfovibrio oxamicus TaxID=32016 RepID=A0ABS0IZ99_9BACT|nr:tetratricopeptide repeat protein [Nitratidesulfovibrio oxamicus]MBG3875515.1 tetratricopeptide repeat protein [Nitratidesulfovibrio oxamicus]